MEDLNESTLLEEIKKNSGISEDRIDETTKADIKKTIYRDIETIKKELNKVIEKMEKMSQNHTKLVRDEGSNDWGKTQKFRTVTSKVKDLFVKLDSI